MEKHFPGGRALIWEALTRGEVPESARDICMASITESTIKQYNTGLKLWWSFCQHKKWDTYMVSVPLVLQFLTHYFHNGATYGTLNSYRSAIAQIAGPELASDFRVKRFFKGAFNKRPTKPKYTITWDPTTVLNYIKTLKEPLNLEQLSYKLITLLAIGTGQRLQTMAHIEIVNIVSDSKGITIRITKRIKTSGLNKLQPTLLLPFFKEDPSICVAKTMLTYLDKTKNLRKNNASNLFISFKKPHQNATSQTLSRWIKRTLEKSGIDTSIFSPHSTRHASTSAAARKGVNMDVIRLTAGWSDNSKTFANFYQRPLKPTNNFLHAVFTE